MQVTKRTLSAETCTLSLSEATVTVNEVELFYRIGGNRARNVPSVPELCALGGAQPGAFSDLGDVWRLMGSGSNLSRGRPRVL